MGFINKIFNKKDEETYNFYNHWHKDKLVPEWIIYSNKMYHLLSLNSSRAIYICQYGAYGDYYDTLFSDIHRVCCCHTLKEYASPWDLGNCVTDYKCLTASLLEGEIPDYSRRKIPKAWVIDDLATDEDGDWLVASMDYLPPANRSPEAQDMLLHGERYSPVRVLILDVSGLSDTHSVEHVFRYHNIDYPSAVWDSSRFARFMSKGEVF